MVLSDLCIRRPVFATVLSLVIVLVGFISYERLTVREYPAIDEPVVSVITNYKGASPEVIESQVTNSEVLAAVGSVRDAMQGFQDITAPESALGVPGYLAELGAQVNALTEASKQLQTLCNAG